jgi:hypothetical protein
MITDNFGKILASMFCNTAGAGVIQTLIDAGNIGRQVQNNNWQSGASAPFFDPAKVGFWGVGPIGSNSNSTVLNLGIGLTAVARSDYKIETLAPGTLGSSVVPSAGAGYGSGIMSFIITSLAATVAATISESVIFKTGNYGFNPQPPYGPIGTFAFLRYNYSPLLVGIGEQVVVDTVLNL